MNKKFLTLGIISLILVGIFIPTVAFGQINWAGMGVDAATSETGTAVLASQQTLGDFIFGGIAKGVGQVLMSISAFVLLLSGAIFDWVMNFTIVKMGENIGGNSAIGLSIGMAWGTLRDIANMVFIFVLLFAAFKAMFDTHFSNFGTTVKNIIIVALLINFSLFFTKVVIDASNIVAVGFYNSVSTNSYPLGANRSAYLPGGSLKGIAGGYAKMLGIQTLYSANILENPNLTKPSQILTIGVMSSVFILITAVILLIVGIMFATRFIILIFLMILSPLALIAFIIPGQADNFTKWRKALVDQSFFAPIYLALTWVVFKLGTSFRQALDSINPGVAQSRDFTNIFNSPEGAIALLINYVLIIGFAIAALIFAKQMATRGAAGSTFKAISGGIATGAIGGTAWLGRQTVGMAGARLAGNARLQEAANKERTGFGKITGAASRLALYASQKAKGASFDVRNAAIPTSALGDAVKGTVGRTKWGQKLGLNDVNIPSVAVDRFTKSSDIMGTAEKKGYAERKAESEKRVHEREAKSASDLAMAKNKQAVLKGSEEGVSSTSTEYGDMEKALSRMSEKETETLVANNRELLRSLNFANTISVKQLEALNKSDQFSDSEKSALKGMRFKAVDEAMVQGNAASVGKNIKALADSELEMIDAKYLEDESFVGQLKGSQVDAINKSNKFTTSQKDKLKEKRIASLINALQTGDTGVSQSITRKADIKTKVGYMKPVGTPPVIIATHPDILPIYTPKMLQRMAAHDDMSDQDIHDLRIAILGGSPTGSGAPGVPAGTINWLKDPEKGVIEFPE